MYDELSMVESAEQKTGTPKEVQSASLSETLKLRKDTAATITYGSGFLPILGWLTGLIMLFLERDRYVRFHALQAVALFGALDVLRLIVLQSALLGRLYSVLYLGQFVLWLLLMYKTYHGEPWALPYIGNWAKGQVAGLPSTPTRESDEAKPRAKVHADPEIDKQVGV